jgi:hypothetical protein
MSYSRYTNSIWYTYHDILSGDSRTNQIFTIDGEFSLISKEWLHLDIYEIVEKLSNEKGLGEKFKPKQVRELATYVWLWCENVNERYPA